MPVSTSSTPQDGYILLGCKYSSEIVCILVFTLNYEIGGLNTFFYSEKESYFKFEQVGKTGLCRTGFGYIAVLSMFP